MTESPALPCLVITGPTAVGKTALVDWLRTQDPQGFELVNADAFQMYKKLDIGTAKPDAQTRKDLPHHLLDILDPKEPYSVAQYCQAANTSILDILGRGRVPVVCGGTMFYLKALLQGLPQAPQADPRIREELRQELQTRGPLALYRDLTEIDPLRAAQLHPNDHYRVTRALEVIRTTGRPQSEYAMTGRRGTALSVRLIRCLRPKPVIDTRIEVRCTQMFAAGLEDEVRSLAAEGYTPRDPGLRAIGYSEFYQLVDGRWEFSPGNHVLGLICAHSRQYAKRQTAFLKHLGGAESLDLERTDEALKFVEKQYLDLIKVLAQVDVDAWKRHNV